MSINRDIPYNKSLYSPKFTLKFILKFILKFLKKTLIYNKY